MAWGAVGWGLGTWTSSWGYGAAYANPYYNNALVTPYDYSQPVALYDYSSVNNYYEGGEGDPPSDVEQQAQTSFDKGLAEFYDGGYSTALKLFDKALAELPGDPVVHEVRALALFAVGKYDEAAAALNSLLSSAPGMDWTTMSSLYGHPDHYSNQLRKLENYCRDHATDAASHFVLAYHYLVLGEKDDAAEELQVVVASQPQDVTAKRMLDALAPSKAAPPAPSSSSGAQTDLVGAWQAKADGTVIDLTIDAESRFVWKATQSGKPPVELSGSLSSTEESLDLDAGQQGVMSGQVSSGGPDSWRFDLAGSPPSAPGLEFRRVK